MRARLKTILTYAIANYKPAKSFTWTDYSGEMDDVRRERVALKLVTSNLLLRPSKDKRRDILNRNYARRAYIAYLLSVVDNTADDREVLSIIDEVEREGLASKPFEVPKCEPLAQSKPKLSLAERLAKMKK